MEALELTSYTATTCLGRGLDAQLAGIRQQSSNLHRCDFGDADIDTWIGTVDGVDDVRLPAELSAYNCRNNRLAYLCLQQDGFEQNVRAAISQHGAHRVGLFLGTSNAGILETELGYRQRDLITGSLPSGVDYESRHSTYSAASFIRRYFQFSGVSVVISTACSSSAKTFAVAARMISGCTSGGTATSSTSTSRSSSRASMVG